MPRKPLTDEDTRTAELLVQEEQSLEKLAEEKQADRERRIAECHEAVGRVQAMKVVGEFANVGSLVWLKDVKETKVYRDLQGIGTWDKFCEHLGISRQKADEDLANLAAFGEQFLLTVGSLRVGYRELKKLRRSASDGQLLLTDGAVTIDGEVIPLDPDHRDDLQAALERVIEANDALLEEKNATLRAKDKVLAAKDDLLKRQEKDLARYEKEAEAQGLALEEAAWLQHLDRFRTTFDGVMVSLDPERNLQLKADSTTPRMIAAYLTTLDYLKKQICSAHQTAADWYSVEGMEEPDSWVPPHLRAEAGGA